jgi:hypothetical protein
MKTDHKLKITFGILSIGLLTTLLFKLTTLPGGMVLPGFILGGFLLIGTLLICLIVTVILKLIYKKHSFLTILTITTTLSFLIIHYSWYSPTLRIKIPNGYNGGIYLVLSNVKENILTVDSNGIGYINKWTFDKTYTKPIVEQIDGKIIEKNLVGYNPSTFWAKSKLCCIDGQVIQSLDFKIVPDDKAEESHDYPINLIMLADRKKLRLSEADSYSTPSEAINADSIK